LPCGDQRSAALSRRSLGEDGLIASGFDPVRFYRLAAIFCALRHFCLRRFFASGGFSPSATSVPPPCPGEALAKTDGPRPGTTRRDTAACRRLFYALRHFCLRRLFRLTATSVPPPCPGEALAKTDGPRPGTTRRDTAACRRFLCLTALLPPAVFRLTATSIKLL